MTFFLSAWKLSKLASKIVSTKSIIGDIIHLTTKFIYRTIENRSSWDGIFNLTHQIETVKEILLLKNNIEKLNKRVINNYDVPSTTVYSDVSSSGLASICKGKLNDKICYKNFAINKEFDIETTWGYKILSGKYKTDISI